MTRGKITTIALFSLFLIFVSQAVLARWVSAARYESQEREKNVAPANEEEEFEGENYLRLRDEYIGMRRGIDPQSGLPDPRLRERAIDQMKRQEQVLQPQSKTSLNEVNPSVPGGSWTPLGPAPLPNSSFGAVSGRTVAIAVDPTNPNIVYLGAAQGGVWRSLDGGQTWVNIFDSADSLAIGAIAIAPSNPSIVYVGTGEPSQSGDSFFGVGLYRIENADTTANLFGPINPLVTSGSGAGAVTYNAFTGRSISKILVHPTDPATIFVSTATGVGGRGNALNLNAPPMGLRGIFRSTNATDAPASVALTKLTVTTDSSMDSPATGNASVIDMVMEPGTPDNIIASVIGRTGAFGGIYRTTNALSAATFTQRLSLAVGIRIEFAINKVGSTVTVYAATGETPTNTPGCTSTNSGAVRKSIDGGDNWSGQLTGGGGYCDGQCGYDISIAVHPTNPNLVYLGGQARGTCSDAMKKSTDGGATFVRDDGSANTLHPDSHALAFDSTGNTIFSTCDGGVWKASVPATGATTWIDLNLSPLNTLQFVGIAAHPFDRNIVIGGTQDNGTELQQGSGGSWTNTRGGDGGYVLIDQSATDATNVTMYHTFFFSGGANGTQIEYERASTVGGGWTPIGCRLATPANGINCTDNVLFYAPMALGPGSPNTVYLGTDRLYRSADRGNTNTVVSQAPISGAFPISSVAISPQDDNYRIVGMQNGEIWATTSGSSTLVNITPATLPANPASTTNRFIGRVMFDPNNKDVVYVGLGYFAPAGQVVWKITNLTAAVASPASANWTPAANGIPSVPVTAFAIDPANSANLFAGTDIGVFNSSDGGSTWLPYGTGLPRVAVFDIAIQNANRVLRVGTHGRGVWEILLNGGVTPSPTPTPTPPVNDNFVNAQVISGCGGTVAGTNLLATKEPGEPNIAGNAGGKSVWYQWQAPASADVTMTTIGSNFDTLLGVYTGNSVGGLTLVKDNDDIVNGINQQSTVTFTAIAGTTYRIAIDGFNAALGNILLNWQQTNCAAPSLILEDNTGNLAAVDSVTLVHGPFSLTDNYNFSFDQRRRIVFFSTDLGFSQTIQPSIDVVSVQIGGQSYSAESVGPNAALGGSQIVFRLPDLAPNSYSLGITVRGVNSTNSPSITIVATSPSSPVPSNNATKTSFAKYWPDQLIERLFWNSCLHRCREDLDDSAMTVVRKRNPTSL